MKYKLATLGEPEPAPADLSPEMKEKWDQIQANLSGPFRTNDGAYIICDEDGQGVIEVRRVTQAKRGKGYQTECPIAYERAKLIVELLNRESSK